MGDTHPFSQSSSIFSLASFMSASTSSGDRLKFSIENAYADTHLMFMFRQTSRSYVYEISTLIRRFCH